MSTQQPPAKRVNVRFLVRSIIFLAIVSALPCWAVYSWVSYNGGHRHSTEGELIDLKALGNFPFDDQNGSIKDVPQEWRSLDGKKVVLEGFMYSRSSAGVPRDFEFVYDRIKCCFGGPPKVQERVFVHVPNGKNVDYIDECAKIVGTLHVHVENKGKVNTIYTMDVDKVEPKE
jgi:hypothetical protein